MAVRPRPPYSRGQFSPNQPFSPILRRKADSSPPWILEAVLGHLGAQRGGDVVAEELPYFGQPGPLLVVELEVHKATLSRRCLLGGRNYLIAPLITGPVIMPFSTPHIVAMVRYSPVCDQVFQRLPHRLRQLRPLGHRPAVRRSVEDLARSLQRTAGGLDREPRHRRIRRHRVDFAVRSTPSFRSSWLT